MDRLERINSQMKKEIGNIVQTELKDPRLSFVTITQVKVSRDLQHAKVFFSVLGKSDEIQKVEEGLTSASGFVRKLVGQRIRMRYTPEIQFYFDHTLEYSARIEATLEEIQNESSENHQSN